MLLLTKLACERKLMWPDHFLSEPDKENPFTKALLMHCVLLKYTVPIKQIRKVFLIHGASGITSFWQNRSTVLTLSQMS